VSTAFASGVFAAPVARIRSAELAGAPASVKIRAERFSFFYGAFQALHDISLEIHQHRITALIGPSGCGKSTFLRSLNRMSDLTPGAKHTGELTIEGHAIHKHEPMELRRRVGMVFQRPNPFPKSIYENVAYGLRIAGVRKEQQVAETVERSLRRAALWEEVKDKLKQSALALSGGQQQRLCIARALAVEPEVLLLDEPCSALDPISTSKIEETVMQLRGQCTVAIVTHNLQQAARVADYTAFFLMGRLVEAGSTQDLFERPVHASTKDYVTGRLG
jgi:phosphate transport system ATP-binding protein